MPCRKIFGFVITHARGGLNCLFRPPGVLPMIPFFQFWATALFALLAVF
jgi:hypothetical protein